MLQLRNFKLKFSVYIFLLITINFSAYSQKQSDLRAFENKDTLTYEKVYLHTDKDVYLAGDVIWFKAYLFDLKYNTPGKLSKNLYVELISPSSKIVKSRLVRLDNGIGHGDIGIPDTSETGTWQIRAYTAWMQNFDPYFVFSKKIQISNVKYSKVNTANTSKTENREYLGFYPESGSMVEQVMSTIAFKASDKNGEGLDVDGFIVTSKNDTVCKVASSHLGMGKFRLCPQKDETYFFKGYINHKMFKSELPKILPLGYILEISDKDSLEESIIIKTNTNTLPADSSKNLFLSFSFENKELMKLAVTLNNLQKVLFLYKKGLPEGIISITLFDENKIPVAERIFYNEIKDSLKFEIESNKKRYVTREKVEFNISADSLINDFKGASLSLSVTNTSFNPVNYSNIKIYKNLESELKGRIENPKMYFDKLNHDRFKQLDLLLMVQGWRNYIWKEIRDTTLAVKYSPERGFTFKGTITQRFSSKPLNNAYLTLWMPQDSQYIFYSTRSDSLGHFCFKILKIYNKQFVKISLRNKKLRQTGCLHIPDWWEHEPLNIIPENKYIFKNDSISRSVQQERKKLARQYKLSDTIELAEFEVKADRIYNIADTVDRIKLLKTYDLQVKSQDSSYFSLLYFIVKNIPEARLRAMNHYIPDESIGETNPYYTDPGVTNLSFAGKHSSFILMKWDTESQGAGNIIDSNEYDYYLAMTMNNFRKVKINKFLNSNFSYYYQVLLFLKPEAYNTCTSYSTLVTGYNIAKEFYSPHYDSDINTNKPDLRTTVYWAPDITTDNKGCAHISFYTSDIKGEYRIDLQGVTPSGKPVAKQCFYKVE
jgi:hypothetical protein